MTQKKPPLVHDDFPYRDCVGLVVFNTSGQVLVAQRKPGRSGKQDFDWQFPQGGIDHNEEPIDAALRELYEETSITSVSILTAAPNWICYDLPLDVLGKALRGRYRGQRQKWFALLFEGKDSEIDVVAPAGGEHPAEFLDWRWETLENVPELVVPFKRDAYNAVINAFADIPRQLVKSH